MAVFILPPEMIGFYKYYIDYLTEHSVDPDKRRYAVDDEAAKHYIDIDYFAKNGEDPFDLMPEKWQDAVAKYTEDTLREYGIVPWQVSWEMYSLTRAFEERDIKKILYVSANLGHYVADAHVPLHTTINYNGQLTDQKGIHGLWESRIPELTADEYDYVVGKAEYIKQPLSYIWNTIKESHSHLDSVLLIEKRLSQEFPADQQFSFERRGQSTLKQYSKEYSLAYFHKMDGMVEERMRKAIFVLGSMWYTAWVNAGQPSLNDMLVTSEIGDVEKKAEELDKKYSTGSEKGRIHERNE